MSPRVAEIILGLVIFALSYGGFKCGQKLTEAEFQITQTKERLATYQEYAALLRALEKREREHEKAVLELKNETIRAQELFETTLHNYRSTYELRLRASEQRSEVYRNQAQSGATACRNLADHAARLDRTIEEGRAVVREFGETLRLRDQQLVILGKQIHTDRLLLEEED